MYLENLRDVKPLADPDNDHANLKVKGITEKGNKVVIASNGSVPPCTSGECSTWFMTVDVMRPLKFTLEYSQKLMHFPCVYSSFIP